MTKQDYQDFFSKPYPDAENFINNIILPIFGDKSYTDSFGQNILTNSNNKEIADRTGILAVRLIGEINPGAYPINLYEIEVKDFQKLRRSRANLQAIIRKETRETFNGAFMLFYDAENPSEWRFSYFDKGESNKEITTAKRYTYLLGEGQQCRTASERFLELANSKNIGRDEILKAFSVEALSKDFYKKLFAWYEWALSPEVKITFPNNTNTAEDDRLKLEEQVIRLVTRLMFVWFIKQKNLVPPRFFEKDEVTNFLKDFDAESSENGNYYNAVLQNLFFATLNKPVDERAFAKIKSRRDIKTLYRYAEMFNLSEDEILELFRPIPFLNGGLFECLDKEDSSGSKYFLDGFSRNDSVSANGNFRHRAFIPNCIFFDEQRGIIPLLKQYNFTVEENSSAEQQVALDPELLGNIFENLLGAFNTETKETARKQSGSFYTPREIVDYMVDESLIAYLKNAVTQTDEDTLRRLFNEDHLPEKILKDQKLASEILNKIKQAKILDPACGSGAFPMGILQRMTDLLDKLDPKSKENHYDLKLHLIENCIYGVDLQTIAAQISKLRFFISLIVEQGDMDISQPGNNYNVITLPNLETKFVSANTLIGIQHKKAGDFVNSLFTDPQIDIKKHELMEVRKKHFYAKSANQKKTLRDQDEKLRKELSELLTANEEFAPEDARQFADWNPYDQNSSAPFLDTEWMFAMDAGFDIVIGNPPYISTKGISKEFKELLVKQYGFADDTYSHFFFKGDALLKNGGVLSYITPKTFWTTQTKRNLRDFILSKKIKYIFDTANPFEAVMVDTCVTSFVKTFTKDNVLKFLDGSKDLADPEIYYINQNIYLNTQNSVIFKPTENNLKIHKIYGKTVKELYNKWWEKISTSRNIERKQS